MAKPISHCECPFCGCPQTQARWFPQRYREWSCGTFEAGVEPYQSVECECNVAQATADRLSRQLRAIGRIITDSRITRTPFGAGVVVQTPTATSADELERLLLEATQNNEEDG